MSIHVAITRRVRAGCEAELQQALREFFQTSFGHRGVMGASLLGPPPGSAAPGYGILRTFRNEAERDAFHDSPMCKERDDRAKTMPEGEPEYRRLDGLEAWFRSPGPPPPRWKMALLTWLAVWPVSMIVAALFAPLLGQILPKFLFAGVVAGGIVIVLTWGAMPFLVRIARPWLHGATTSTNIPEKR